MEPDTKRIGSYRDLRIYQQSYQAALEIHQVTLRFPAFERGELGSQLRRARRIQTAIRRDRQGNQQADSGVARSFQSLASSFQSLDLVGEHCVESEGRPRGLLNTTQETLPA